MDLIVSYYLIQKINMEDKKQKKIKERNENKIVFPLKKSDSFSKTCERCGQSIVWCNCKINNN